MISTNLLSGGPRDSGAGLAFCALALSLWLLPCAQVGAAEPAEKSGSLAGSYLSSRFARANGDVTNASRYVEESLAHDPANQELLAQSFKLLLTKGNVDEAVRLAEKLAKVEGQDPLVDLSRAVAQAKAGRYGEAATLLRRDGQTGLNSVIVPLLTAWLDFAGGKVTRPLEISDLPEAASGFSSFAQYHLALINDLAGFKEVAGDSYRLAIKDAAKAPYRMVKAFGNFYERSGEKEKAKALYEQYRVANPESFALEGRQVEDSLALSEGNAPAPMIADAKQGIAELFFAMASMLYGEEASLETLVYTQLALYLQPDFAAAQIILASTYEQAGDYAKAEEVYRRLKPESPLYHKAQMRIAFNQDKQGREADALAQLDGLIAANPERYDAYLAKGDILRNHQRFKEAAEAYDGAIQRLGKAEKRHWPILYVRGVCYEQSGQWDKAEVDFKQVLALEPGQPDVLNYLGYSWLVMGRNIAEAKAMIEKAVKARPADPQIVDSMGWALYHLGEFPQAVEYLEKAVDLTPGDSTVNEHLGDAYWRIGRKTQARFQWERALIFSPKPDAVSAIKKKLEMGLPAFDKPAKEQASEGKGGQTRTQ